MFKSKKQRSVYSSKKPKQQLFLNYVIISLLFIAGGCKSADKDNLPDSTGKLGSLVVVSDATVLNGLKTNLENAFLKQLPQSPSSEPFIELLKPDIEEFSKFYYNQKIIFVLVTETNMKEMEELLSPFSTEIITKLTKDPRGIISQKDLFAKHQHIVYLFGKDMQDIGKKLAANNLFILNTLLDFELKDQSERLYTDTTGNEQYYKLLKDKYGIGVRVPGSFKMMKESDNFYWFQMDTKDVKNPKSIGLIIHAYPYNDTSDFSYLKIRNARDSFCKYNIPGELKGTYMGTTESDYYPARSNEMMHINGYQTAKVKGWWTFRGLSMAGPFIRYVVHVPEKKLLFAFEGFVYSANINMRERDLRLIEAIALTIK